VEYIAILFLIMSTESLIIDFGSAKSENWYSVNDGVMGGRSSGNTRYSEDALSFSGDVSFANNGGFASVRSDYQNWDFSNYSQVTIKYRCEGQSLALSLDHYGRWYQPNYKIVLPATEMKWETLTVPLKDFKEYRVGRLTGNNISKEVLTRIIRMGIITNDKKEGPFKAEIDFIEFN
jgi:NADH dehydrogenase [ubiquinone] 1 alpha subcomplex assembly factor 1